MKNKRSNTRVVIPSFIISMIELDSSKYLNKQQHYTKMKISAPTYRALLEMGECRTDVLDKIKKHLKIK